MVLYQPAHQQELKKPQWNKKSCNIRSWPTCLVCNHCGATNADSTCYLMESRAIWSKFSMKQMEENVKCKKHPLGKHTNAECLWRLSYVDTVPKGIITSFSVLQED